MIELLGYYTYTIPSSCHAALMNICLDYGVTIYHTEEREGEVLFRLSAFFAARAERAFHEAGLDYRRGELRGALGGFRRLGRHPGVIIGAVISVVLYLLLSNILWEVRVVSRTDVDEDRVLALLAECGLHEGRPLSRIDEDALIADYLMIDETIAFAAVHLRGVVAEVEIIPYDVSEEPAETGEPCNIVASEDALITDITVYAGRAMVKVGQTVRAGDILVSGIVTDASGVRLVRAAADIRGQRTCDLQVVSPIEVTETVATSRRLTGVGVTLFGHTFGTADSAEDALVTRRRIYLFDRIRLPLEIASVYHCETQETLRVLSEEEQCLRAEAMMEELLEQTLGDGALLSMEKRGYMTDDGYTVMVHMNFENNIGKALAILTENQ